MSAYKLNTPMDMSMYGIYLEEKKYRFLYENGIPQVDDLPGELQLKNKDDIRNFCDARFFQYKQAILKLMAEREQALSYNSEICIWNKESKTFTGFIVNQSVYVVFFGEARKQFIFMFIDSTELFDNLFKEGLQLVTGIRSNMKNKLMPLFDKRILRKRSMIESVNNQIKKVFQVEYARHRSPFNECINIIAGLVAFTHHANKPNLNMTDEELPMLQMTAEPRFAFKRCISKYLGYITKHLWLNRRLQ